MELPIGPHAQTIKRLAKELESPDEALKKSAYKQLLRLSLESDPEALYSLASAYEYGIMNAEKKPNPELAFKTMKQAADLNYGPAYIKISQYTINGFGTEKNPASARDYYELATNYYATRKKQTDPIATENAKMARLQLALIYLYYFSDDKVKVKAALDSLKHQVDTLFSKDAALALAKYFEEKNDPEKSEQYYLKALEIKHEDHDLQIQLANMYLRFFPNAPAKIASALKYLNSAVEKSSNPLAAIRLASYYLDHQDFDKAKYYLEKITDTQGLSLKNTLEGLFYLNDLNPSRNLLKALESFEKALLANPHDDMALFGKWKIWQESPELINNEAEIHDILAKILKSNEPQTLFEIALGYLYGIYGLEKNPAKAKEYFKKVIDDRSIDSDGLKAIIYRDGLYEKKDIALALKTLERSRSKSQWAEQLYTQLQELLPKELIEKEESAKKTAKKAHKKEPKKISVLQKGSSSETAQEAHSEQETDEFDEPPEDPSLLQDFKKGLIHEINKKYHPDDGSYVRDIHFDTGEIIIEDPRHSKEIILFFNQDQSGKRKKHVIKKLVYDPRVEQWFTKTQEELLKIYQESTIDNHTFAKIVDSYMQLYGIQIPRNDNKRGLFLPGEIINITTGFRKKVNFEYTFYQDKPGQALVLYHRLARPVVR